MSFSLYLFMPQINNGNEINVIKSPEVAEVDDFFGQNFRFIINRSTLILITFKITLEYTTAYYMYFYVFTVNNGEICFLYAKCIFCLSLPITLLKIHDFYLS